MQRSVIEHNRIYTNIWSIQQFQTFDYRTVDSRTQLNVRLPNSCLFNFYIEILTLIKNKVTKMKKMPEY